MFLFSLSVSRSLSLSISFFNPSLSFPLSSALFLASSRCVLSSQERAKEVEFLKAASSDELKDMFRQYRGSDAPKNIGMTETEAERINDCLGKDEFMNLFRDYVDDISDPKNQEEYDQYLRQLEEEGEIPENEEIVRPTPGFVVKIKSDVGSKLFVNICGTPKVPRPSQGPRPAGESMDSTGSQGDGASTGAFWSIPYIHTSMRMDQDKEKNPCHVYDILFNLDTIKLCESQGPRFKALVVQTALESIEVNGKVKLKNGEGKYDFQIMPKMTYKGQVVRPHKLKKDVLEQPKAPPPKSNDKPKPKPSAKKKVEEEDPAKPKMTVVHRGEIALGDYMQNMGMRDLPISSRPKELVIKLELPLMQSAADMDLDIKGGYLEFKAEKAGYNLKHKLPYPVDEATGDAKYVKAQKLLTVTLQVLPWAKAEIEAEVARAEEVLATQQADAKKQQEEECKKAEEEAKQVVKRGFLDTNSKGKKIKTPAATAEDGDGAAAVSSALSDLSLGDSIESHSAATGGGARDCTDDNTARRPNIEDLGECVPADMAVAGSAVQVVMEEDGGEPFVSFRQNQKNVTAVVRVTGIEATSLVIDIQQTRVCMRFSALCAAVEGAADGALKRVNYTHTLHLAEAVDPMHSRYDAADTNLVLVLRKFADTRWATFTGAPRDGHPPVAPAVDAAVESQTAAAAAAESAAATHTEEDRKHVSFGGEMGPSGGAANNTDSTGVARDMAVDIQAVPIEEVRQAGGDAQVAHVRRVVGAQGEIFESADSFAGSREGFVFKKGSHGLGYYTDKPLHTQPRREGDDEEGEEAEGVGTKLASDPAPSVAPPAMKFDADKPVPKLPFNNTLLYDLD